MARPKGSRNRGWSITPRPGGRYEARVTIPGGAQKSKRFTTKKDARAWAEKVRANAVLLRTIQAREIPSSELVEEFKASLERRQLSASYRTMVASVLAGVLETVPDLAAPDAPVRLLLWWERLRNSMSPTSCNIHLRVLTTLVNWDQRRRPGSRVLLDDHLLTDLEPVKVPEKPKDQFTVAELRAIVAARKDRYWPRAMLRLYLGLRNLEAENLDWRHLDLDSRVAEVTGKGGKTRLVQIPSELLGLLQAEPWPLGPGLVAGLRWQRQGGHYWKPGVTPANNGGMTTRDFDQFLARIGIEKRGRSPHSFRHSYAGIMAATGVSQYVLAGWLGHSGAMATAGYAAEAARYVSAVEGWPRGQFVLAAVGP
jgi:integrase